MCPSTRISPVPAALARRGNSRVKAERNPKADKQSKVNKKPKAAKKCNPSVNPRISPAMIQEQISIGVPDTPARSQLRQDMRTFYWGEEVHDLLVEALMENTLPQAKNGVIAERWRAERALAHRTDAIGENHTFRTAGLIANARKAQENLLLFPHPGVVIDAPDSEAEDAIEDAEHLRRRRRRHRAGDHHDCNPAVEMKLDLDGNDNKNSFCDDPDMVDGQSDGEERARIEAHLEQQYADYQRDVARRCAEYERQHARRTAEADATWEKDVEEERVRMETEEHLMLRAPLAEDDEHLRRRQEHARRRAEYLGRRSQRVGWVSLGD